MSLTIQEYTITNKSPQVVPILYDTIAKSKSVSPIQFDGAGIINLQPGIVLTIEAERVDIGQLNAFRNKGLISYQ